MSGTARANDARSNLLRETGDAPGVVPDAASKSTRAVSKARA